MGGAVSGFYLQFNPIAGNKLVFNRLDSDSAGSATIMAEAKAEVVTGTWYHLVGVYDAAAKTISLYLNGQLQETVPFTAAWQATGNTAIGRGFYDGYNVDFVNGSIDAAQICAVALSASQIQALATKTSTASQ